MTHRPSGDIDASDSRTLKAPEVGRSPPSTRFRNPGPTSASGLLERDGVPPCQGVGDSGHRNWEPEVRSTETTSCAVYRPPEADPYSYANRGIPYERVHAIAHQRVGQISR